MITKLRIAALALVLAACGDASPSPEPGTAGPSITPTPAGQSISPSPEPSGERSPTPTTYTVRGGDTLSSISRQFGVTVAQLQAWNAERHPGLVTDPNDLEAGWELIVSGDPGATPAATPVVTPRPATPAPSVQPSASSTRMKEPVPRCSR